MIDEGRFVAEVMAMRPMLYRLSMSIVHHDADAQDAVSQAIENAWRHRARVDTEAFRAYLTRIAINECKSLLRRKRRSIPTEDFSSFGATVAAPDAALSDALGRVPEKLRTPLLLHYMEQFSLREIAQILSVPVTTVRSRLARGREALRNELGEEE